MFYVIQTAPAKEYETKIMIEKLVGENLFTRCFILTRDMRKKIKGEWKTVEQKLFPGYIFIETDKVTDLYLSSKNVPVLTKFIGREEKIFEALTEK